MKVRELIEKLQELDPEEEIFLSGPTDITGIMEIEVASWSFIDNKTLPVMIKLKTII